MVLKGKDSGGKGRWGRHRLGKLGHRRMVALK